MRSADQRARSGPGRPRLALMGEFSSGKSTLSKLLLGHAPLPVRVTATRFPPVWISHGEEAAWAVGHDGTETPIEIADLSSVRIEETRLIRLHNMSDTLEICDLIDMPGISDPSMAPDIWRSMIDEIDSVVWCSQATQAWRQTEAAAWQAMMERTNGDNILLVTQVDKLRSDRDLERVLKRVRKETEGLFKAVYPLSILKAIEAGEDAACWEQSGAAAFVDHLIDLLLSPSPRPQTAPEASTTQEVAPEAGPVTEALVAPEPGPAAAPEPVPQAAPEQAPTDAGPVVAPPAPEGVVVNMQSRVMPKRVRVLTRMRGRVSRPDQPIPLERRDGS